MWKKFRHAKKYVYTVHDTVRAENKTELMVYHALNVGYSQEACSHLKQHCHASKTQMGWCFGYCECFVCSNRGNCGD